jgi:signal transduction histidine kinase
VGHLCHFAEGFFRGTPVRCRLNLPARLPDYPVSTEVRNHLSLAVKEALNNVRKHAQAGEVMVQVQVAESLLTVTVQDNGQGFIPERSDAAGNGLVNMRKRLEQLGGRFELETQPRLGTLVRLSVPVFPKPGTPTERAKTDRGRNI